VATAAGRVFVIPVGDELREPYQRQALEPLVGSLGYDRVSWVELSDIEELVDVASVVDRRAEQACGGPVALSEWSARLTQAQEQLQLLEFGAAMGALAALELDVACLGDVPRRADLFLLGVVMAEAHHLASAGTTDAGVRMFHASEVRHGLRLAATFGADLPPPSWLVPELNVQLLDTQASFSLEETVPVFLGGSAKGLFLDGKHVTTGFKRLSPGAHLVQATVGQRVVAAGLIESSPGRRLMIRVTPAQPPLMPADLSIALRRLEREELAEPFLADLLGLLAGEADDALVAVMRADGPALWGRGKGGMVLRYPFTEDGGPPALSFDDLGQQPAPLQRPARPDPFPWTLGLGPCLWGSDLQGAHLDGLGGLAGGLALDARVTLSRRLAAAAVLQPVARAEPLPAGYDARWLWRAIIPLRTGIRVGPPAPALSFEAGADLGLLYLGRFREQEFRLLAVLAAGLYLPLAPVVGLKVEAWAGLGNDLVAGGLQLVAVAHPPPGE